jgi:hypothetical protein
MSVAGQETATADAPAAPPLHRRLRGGHRLRDGRTLYWWLEAGFVAVFYAVYSTIRNLNDAGTDLAFEHAKQIIRLQLDLGIFHEQTIQAWALHVRPLIVGSNYFYGSLHFIVTGGVMIYLYRRWTNDYPLWRNTLAIATAIALIGFAFYPLMPPRLLPSSYHFVDTLAKDPAFWSFNSGAMNRISNQYAAMPSVHCAWALWCACVLVPRLRPIWAKAIAVIYPVLTVTAIVVTANHYFLDAVAGFAVLGIAYLLARIFTRAGRRPAVASATPLTLPIRAPA